MGVKVAIIDSAISRDLVLIETKKRSEYCIEDGRVVGKEKINTGCTHGTHVLNNILYECSDIEVISVEILDQNNKGKALDLLKALEFCIQEKVSFINISLGISTTNTVLIDALKIECDKAVERGIVIISAKENSGANSYPASFSNVISVSSNHNNAKEEYVSYDEEQNDICFCSADIMSKGNNNFEILTGNSYLCGYVTGVVSSCHKTISNLNEAKKAIKFFGDTTIKNRIFIKPFFENELRGNTQFVYFGDNPFDIYLKEILEAKTRSINWLDVKNKRCLDVDAVVFGAILLPCEPQLKEDILNWLVCMNNKIRRVYCLAPIFNTRERYEISKKYNIYIREIYI